jgi:nitroimidazol reductase NimA-like FMN-containing flavoprotein (pyridoxamine 5'-phosphate oxidase superfamily)
MSVRLSSTRRWEVIRASHTGILTTLRRDGWPVSLPVWFCVLDELIYVRTPQASQKVARIRRDERACFLVESGQSWSELRAVVLRVAAAIVEDIQTIERVEAKLTAKYGAYRPRPGAMPERSRVHYSRGSAVVALSPVGEPLSWDNAQIVASGAGS